MSHIVKAKGQASTKASITKAAAEDGGIIIKKNTHVWYGRHIGDYKLPEGYTENQMGKCDFAIKYPSVNYEVGVVRKPGGKHEFLFDFYGSGGRHDGQKLQEIVGEGCGRLLQKCHKHAMKATALQKGLTFSSKSVGNKVKVTIGGF